MPRLSKISFYALITLAASGAALRTQADVVSPPAVAEHSCAVTESEAIGLADANVRQRHVELGRVERGSPRCESHRGRRGWTVPYSFIPFKLDACFAIFVDDETRKTSYESCT